MNHIFNLMTTNTPIWGAEIYLINSKTDSELIITNTYMCNLFEYFRNEMNSVFKSLLIKTQNWGSFLINAKLLTYIIIVTYIINNNVMTIEQTIRVIGWMDMIHLVVSFEIPNAIQHPLEMVASLERIEVMQGLFHSLNNQW